ncbi:MAG: HAMP domain-containing histidine kinase [Pseudomonadota bacterium]|nr:HAMP domain-containing histidine kinase [Pseudomonadota bacterium]
MRRPGLFRALLWRELIIISGCVVALYFFSTWITGRFVNRNWQQDLQQETEWTARTLPSPLDPLQVAKAWRGIHPYVRFVLRDPEGQILVDTHPDWASLGAQAGDAPLLVGQSDTGRGAGRNTLTLSRYGAVRHPWHNEFVLLLLAFLTFAGAVLYPLVRELTVSFDRLSQVARQVAGGQFGETLEPPRQRELADLVASFNNMSLRLRDAEARQKQLIADVSHELRSPLGRLRALAETIGRRPAEATPYLLQIDSEISLLDRLVGDLLDMARFDAGEAQLKIERVALLPWAQDAFGRSRSRIEQHGVLAATHLPVSDIEVMIDPQRLLQAFSNLVENALVASLERAAAKIELRLTVSAMSWCLSVTDNGRGIPAEDLPFVFDRFFRVEKHRGRRTGGAGLGLSIARASVIAQGGEIAIDSTVDLGTTVRLSFPHRT